MKIKVIREIKGGYCTKIRVFLDGKEFTLEQASSLMTETESCDGVGIFSDGEEVALKFNRGEFTKEFVFYEPLRINKRSLESITTILTDRAYQVRSWSRSLNLQEFYEFELID